MNDNNELDALFARIKDDLYEPCPECNGTGVDTGSSDRCSVCDGKEFIPNHDAQAALATLRTKLATLEAERDALLKALFPFAGIYEDYKADCEQGYKRSFSRWFYDGTTHDDTEAFSTAFETYTALRKQS